MTVLALPAAGSAQSTTLRSNFAFHVHVDPLFGDDGQAMPFNPNGTTIPAPGAPLSLHPHKHIDPTSPTYLQVFPSELPPALRSAGGATDLELARRAAREMVERFGRGGMER